ncbi:conserved hypothetical protein [Dinoroseobacter shibae DFL 12 = DSM 16493]|jgi:hypothetical protein|uniref:PepSY domain-containing protein n=1 Tax=Dinoroseobacter shibae (strain DSM 16493 / NCIMB 14021 / DFL 12) TaxID=398580 RepID=A8LNS6_DINSH|nr:MULTISPECIES: PepSY domain-containing protein [Dinoroseobacter]TNY46453.1 PepSY domain-containing protein [Streptococcus pyogenes]ABV92234.1 conserved hypothetical protein [Dinoroseobacter shibae DFL 12 = DSM 16493]MDD9717433.1 PepSY domain-containing protein [Dinoroseobacter sp. PD6]URF47185.1 PepSY domain-containing protein [Dinoroseobacter shibae]URF51496.1 PepSY domain-containing protein [Dinoroseobacter shibae]
MKPILAFTAAMVVASTGFASEVDEATEMKIMAMLAEMECQMDADDIEVEDDGYDLDDVICKGGNQFDIKLDKEFNEVSRRAE